MKKQTQKQSKCNITTGKKFSTPENYNGINTPYFSAGDYTQTKRPTPAHLDFLKGGITRKKERSLLEFLGQKITLEIVDITALDIEIIRTGENGEKIPETETKAFYKCKFPKGEKCYFFAINSIFLDTLAENGLLPKMTAENEAVETAHTTFKQLCDMVGHTIQGYFYYTMDNGGGKKLFPTAESVEKYHNAIQLKFENSIEQASAQTPQEQEKAN